MRTYVFLCGILVFVLITPVVQAVGSIDQSSISVASVIPDPEDIEVVIDIRPNTLHENSKGRWVTCYITPPEGYDAGDIDIATVMLEEVPALPDHYGYVDIDQDGICELMVKFDRGEILALIPPGTNDAYPLCIEGCFFDDVAFYGVDTVHTKRNEVVMESMKIEYFEVFIDIRPDTLQSYSNGDWVTCYISPPDGYSARDIDVVTVTLEGVSALTNRFGYVDVDSDGVCELMVKFDRDAILALFPVGISDTYTLQIAGNFLDGFAFYGTDTLNVVYK